MSFLDTFRQVRDHLILRKAIRNGLVLGREVRIMSVPRFGTEPYLISIGNHVTLAPEVAFITHDGATWVFRHRPEYYGLQSFGRIDIEDNCFIGARAVLLPGIRIGPNAVVAAGAVVTRSVPPDTVVAGVPARPICSTAEYVERVARRCISCPPELQRDPQRLKQVLLERYPYVPALDGWRAEVSVG